MGRQGIRRRKRIRRLPKVREVEVNTYDHPDPYTPMGVVAGYGNLASATRSRVPRIRRRALMLWGILALPLFAGLLVGVIGVLGII